MSRIVAHHLLITVECLSASVLRIHISLKIKVTTSFIESIFVAVSGAFNFLFNTLWKRRVPKYIGRNIEEERGTFL